MTRRYLAASAGLVICFAIAVYLECTHEPMYVPAIIPMVGVIICAELIRRWA